MTDIRDVEAAERIGRGRARLFIAQGLLFMIWQTMFFAGYGDGPLRLVDKVYLGAWLVWAVMLLVLLATGGGYFRSSKVRELLDDELTRRHRSSAYIAGFWTAMMAAIAVYVMSMFFAVTAREAVHLILS